MFHHVLSIKICAGCNSLKGVNEGKENGKRGKRGKGGLTEGEEMDRYRCGKAKPRSGA